MAKKHTKEDKDKKKKAMKKHPKMTKKGKAGKKHLKEGATNYFVSALIDNNFSAANGFLKLMVNEKIKQQIINNNVKIF